MAACLNALSITELLERILLHLPLPDLLLLARVSRSWKEVWDGSIKIQRALFLQAANQCEIDFVGILDRNWYGWGWASGGVHLPLLPILNPFFNKFIYVDRVFTTSPFQPAYRILLDTFVLGLNPQNPLYPDKKLGIFHRGISDWRSMLLTQPAIQSFDFVCTNWGSWVFDNDGDEVTLDTVHEKLHGHLRTCCNCSKSWNQPNRWQWMGQADVEMVDLNITGWEMINKLDERKRVVKWWTGLAL